MFHTCVWYVSRMTNALQPSASSICSRLIEYIYVEKMCQPQQHLRQFLRSVVRANDMEHRYYG